jgi:hypothetical protein
MSGFDGSGQFIRSYSWVQDAANSIPITASRFDTEHNGFAAGLSNCITRDGQGKPSANIDWNAHKITNLANPTGLQDAVTLTSLTNPTALTVGPDKVQTAAEIAAGVTPTNYAYDTTNYGEPFRYMSAAQITDVLSAARSLDVTAAITTALSLSNDVWLPAGDWRTDTMITVPPGKMLRLSQKAMIVRVTAASAVTPVVYLQGTRSAFDGGQIATEKNHAGGVVACGHLDNTTNSVATWWQLRNVNIEGVAAAGNIGIFVPSGQATIGPTAVNYFGNIHNVHVHSADIGLLFAEVANAHSGSDLQFWNCRTTCIEFRGAGESSLSNIFFHSGSANGLVGIRLSNKTVYTNPSTMNTIIGFTDETGGAADQCVVIGTEPTKNTIIGNDNVAGGNTISNRANRVILKGQDICGEQVATDTLVAYTKFQVSNTFSATRNCFIESNNTINTVAVGGTLVLKTAIASGMFTLRNASDGVTAVLINDSVTGVRLLDGGGFAVVGADPGAGSSKFWVTQAAGVITITNRYAVAKQMDAFTFANN